MVSFDYPFGFCASTFETEKDVNMVWVCVCGLVNLRQTNSPTTELLLAIVNLHISSNVQKQPRRPHCKTVSQYFK